MWTNQHFPWYIWRWSSRDCHSFPSLVQQNTFIDKIKYLARWKQSGNSLERWLIKQARNVNTWNIKDTFTAWQISQCCWATTWILEYNKMKEISKERNGNMRIETLFSYWSSQTVWVAVKGVQQSFTVGICFFTTHCSLRLNTRSELDVSTFAIRRLHACHHARALSGGRWNCGWEMSRNFA